jgi:hypothetical protein
VVERWEMEGVGEEWTITHLVNSSDPVVERWEMDGVGEEWTDSLATLVSISA